MPAYAITALMTFMLLFCSAPTLGKDKAILRPEGKPVSKPEDKPQPTPDEKVVLKLTAPMAPLRLFGANCLTSCWLSGLFAPAVVREYVTEVPLSNAAKEPVTVTATFVPTNGLAMAQKLGYLTLEGSPGENMLGANHAAIQLPEGDTTQLKLALTSTQLPAGVYTGQVQFKATGPNADPVTQVTAVELRIRDSVLWALITVILGIALGRIAQLVYDPKVTARVQLLDWLNELEEKVNLLPPSTQMTFKSQLAKLKIQLLSRSTDPTSLQSAFQALELQVEEAGSALSGGVAAPASVQTTVPQQRSRFSAATDAIRRALRVLAGVTPLSLPSVYDWLLPLFVLLTLVALATVFVLQQYGGTGTAETFGAGGLADYAALFLAGVASEAIAGGLRAVKLR